MKNKLKMSKQGKLGKTNLKLQNKGHGGMKTKRKKCKKVEGDIEVTSKLFKTGTLRFFCTFFIFPHPLVSLVL